MIACGTLRQTGLNFTKLIILNQTYASLADAWVIFLFVEGDYYERMMMCLMLPAVIIIIVGCPACQANLRRETGKEFGVHS